MPQSPHRLRNDLKCVEWDVKPYTTNRWCLQDETTKCEVCEQDVLLRLYKQHLRLIHSVYTYRKEHTQDESATKQDDSATALDVEDNRSNVRGSRAAALKYVEY